MHTLSSYNLSKFPAEYAPTPSQYHCLCLVYVSSSADGPDTQRIFHFAAGGGGEVLVFIEHYF